MKTIDTKALFFLSKDRKVADPYTVVYLEVLKGDRPQLWGRGMSEHPCHPQGVGMSFHLPLPIRNLKVRIGRANWLGVRIPFSELPPDCQRLVTRDLEPEDKP